MMKRMTMVAIAAAALSVAGCSSPVDSAQAPPEGSARADASVRTAADTTTARNGGNLMGGN